MIGAITPLFIVWLVEKYKQRKTRKEYLYFLERMIVDQINMLIETRETTTKFLNQRIDTLINNINNNPNTAYSVDGAFFPLFSIRALPTEINTKSSNSGYIDNKVGKIYALSQDLPHMINDIRLQLKDTLERNEKIAFGKLNSPEVQKEQYKINIQEFEKMVRRDILETNIPIYFKLLSETLVAVRKKAQHGILWKIKFDLRWKLYFKKSTYLKAKSEIMENMDKYFKPETEQQLKIINDFKT